jgi:hypothetical protein
MRFAVKRQLQAYTALFVKRTISLSRDGTIQHLERYCILLPVRQIGKKIEPAQFFLHNRTKEANTMPKGCVLFQAVFLQPEEKSSLL